MGERSPARAGSPIRGRRGPRRHGGTPADRGGGGGEVGGELRGGAVEGDGGEARRWRGDGTPAAGTGPGGGRPVEADLKERVA